MADLIIKLIVDPTTGKKNIVIGYESDSDALPMEHEEDHRRIVDKLIEGGALKAAEVGSIIVERVEKEAVATDIEETSGEAQSLEQEQ